MQLRIYEDRGIRYTLALPLLLFLLRSDQQCLPLTLRLGVLVVLSVLSFELAAPVVVSGKNFLIHLNSKKTRVSEARY